MSKRILVTGGAGFLGSHLCGRLLCQGHTVTALDSLTSGSLLNLEQIRQNPNFHPIVGDVRRFPALAHDEFDEIYNLACPASPIQYQRHPIDTLMTCVVGAESMLDLARRCGAKVLQASTSEVYGDPLVHPQKETDRGHVNFIGPRGCYDEGKRAAETLFFDHHRKYGTRIKVARIFNTYGPRMRPDDGRVVSNFIVQALAGEPLAVYGGGPQTRSFCYVDDMIDALMLLMETSDDVTGPVNLGNPQETAIGTLAERIVLMTGSHSAIKAEPLPKDDPFRRKPDISLAKKLLNWTPKIELTEGLERTIAYFREMQAKAAAA